VLVAEKKCREELERVKPMDPVEHFDAYNAALNRAGELGLMEEPLSKEVKAKFASVKKRKETTAALRRGIDRGDRGLIEDSLEQLVELEKEWGPIVSEAERKQAAETLEVIRKEDEALSGLREALLSDAGRLKGKVGELDLAGIETGSVRAAAVDCKKHNIRTDVGKSLIEAADAIVAMREAFLAKHYPAIEAAVSVVTQLREDGRLGPEASAEVELAVNEIMDRRV